jgi:carbohydrate-selective porin OprB
MDKSIFLSLMLTVFVVCFASVSFASDIEKRVEALEQHVDKHITHAEGPALMDGLNIAAGITMVGQTTSGNDENSTGSDSTDGTISADIELSKKLGDNGEAFIALDAGAGNGIDADVVTYWVANGDAGDTDDDVTLLEAWYEHVFYNGMVTFTIGKVDMSNYFDGNAIANDETTQFLAGGFINSVAIEFNENNPSPGIRLTVSPHEMVDITFGAQSNDWDDLDEGTFYMGEAVIKPKIGELEGNYRIHVWTNMTDREEIADAAADQAHNTGYGLNIDQQVTNFLTLFTRLDFADDKVAENDFVWSAGLALSGSLWNRNDDVVGIAYGEANLSDDQKDTLANPGDETHFEAYYNIAVNEHVGITPDVQAVTNALGDDDFETVWIWGVRGQFTF